MLRNQLYSLCNLKENSKKTLKRRDMDVMKFHLTNIKTWFRTINFNTQHFSLKLLQTRNKLGKTLKRRDMDVI